MPAIKGIIREAFTYKDGIILCLEKRKGSKISKVFVSNNLLKDIIPNQNDLSTKLSLLIQFTGKELYTEGEEEYWYGGQVPRYIKADFIKINISNELQNIQSKEHLISKIIGINSHKSKELITSLTKFPSTIFNLVGKKIGHKKITFPQALMIYRLVLNYEENVWINKLPEKAIVSFLDWFLIDKYTSSGKLSVSISEIFDELNNHFINTKTFEETIINLKKRFKIFVIKEDTNKEEQILFTSFAFYNIVQSLIKTLCKKLNIEFKKEYVDNIVFENGKSLFIQLDNILRTESIDIQKLEENLIKNKILCIKGSGGVGKTTTLLNFIDYLQNKGHSCLYLTLTGSKASDVQGGKTIAHALKNDIPSGYSVVAIDEISTIDLIDFYKILKKTNSRYLIITGAEDQNSPPKGKEIYNSILIPLLSQKEGAIIELTRVKRYKQKVLYLIPYSSEKEFCSKLSTLVNKLNNLTDSWIITTPYHDVFPGTKHINNLVYYTIVKKQPHNQNGLNRLIITTKLNIDGMVISKGSIVKAIKEVDDENMLVSFREKEIVLPKKYLSLAYALEYYHVQGLEVDFCISIIPDRRTIEERDFSRIWNVISTRARKATFVMTKKGLLEHPILKILLEEEKVIGSKIKNM